MLKLNYLSLNVTCTYLLGLTPTKRWFTNSVFVGGSFGSSKLPKIPLDKCTGKRTTSCFLLVLFPTFGSKIASQLFQTCSWFVRRILRGNFKRTITSHYSEAWKNHQKQSNHRLPHSICFRLHSDCHFSGVTLWFRTLSATRRAGEGSTTTAPFHTGQ